MAVILTKGGDLVFSWSNTNLAVAWLWTIQDMATWQSPGCGSVLDAAAPRMWKSPGFVSLQDLAASIICDFQDVSVSRIWHSPGCGSIQDLAASRIGQHPGCGIPQDLAVFRIWQPSGFGVLQDVAVSRMWHSPGCHSSILQSQDLTFSRIWQRPGFGVFQDLAFSRMWQSPGYGNPRDLAVARISWERRTLERSADPRRVSLESGRFSYQLDCESSMWLLADGLWRSVCFLGSWTCVFCF